jgi:CPA2 family monovalent cation:H+ antiporter-2
VPKRLTHPKTLGITPEETSHASDHVVIIGYGLNGRNLALALKRVSIPYVVIEMNPETVSKERKRGEPILYGDASTPEILDHAGIRRARVLVIAVSDPSSIRRSTELARRMHPALHIIVRTRYLQEMMPLMDLGANEVVPEEFETSLEIFSRTLRKLLVPRDVGALRPRGARHGYGALRADIPSPRSGIRGRPIAGAELRSPRGARIALAGKSLEETNLQRQTGANDRRCASART